MFARVLLAATVVCLGRAVPLIQPSDEVCQTLSTSCQDLWVASSCKSVKPCIELVWEKLEVPMDKSNVCNICKEMVKEARDQLLSNETQEELRQVLEGSCELIPIEFISNLCKEMVDNFIPDLIDILVSRLDPDQVCTIAGLCNPDFVTRKLQNVLQHRIFIASIQSRIFLPPVEESAPAPVAEDGASCTECKTAMKYAREMFQKLPLDGVQAVVLKVCQEKFGSSSPECSALVNVVLPPVFKYLQSMDTEEFCAYVNHCKSMAPPKLSIPPIVNVKDNLTCDFCKQMVEHLRQLMAANTTEEEFKQSLLNFCEVLGAAAEECESLVNEYFDMVYSYIIEALNPDVFCSTLGLCPPSLSRGNVKSEEKALNKLFIKVFQGALQQKAHLKNLKNAGKGPAYVVPSKSVPLIKVYPALPKKYLESNRSDIVIPMVKTFPAHRNVAPEDIYTCSICKAFITLLEQIVPLNATVDDVKFVLDQICELFPAETEKKCRYFVDTNADVILKFLAHDVAPAVICHEIALCSPPPPPREVGARQDSPDCDYCKMTVQFFYDELKKKETEEELKQLVDKLCQLCPSKYRGKCISTMNSYVDQLISLVLQEFTPEQICQELGFCASANVSAPSIPPKKVSDDECDLCQVIVKFVYDELKDQKTEEEVKQALDKVCSLLPDSLKQKCVDTVNTYYDTLVNLIVQGFTPEQVCQELGLCTSSSALRKPVETKVPEKASDEECALCQIVVKMIYNELKDQKTEEEIKQALDKVCSLLPDSLQQRCVNTVNTYFDQLVVIITQGLTPEEACQELGICPQALKPALTTSPVKTANSEQCDYCVTVVQYVYDALKDEKTEEMIKKALDEACYLFHGQARQECVNMVNTYFEIIASLVLQEFTPQQICQTLGLCPATLGGELECTFCEYALHFIQNELVANATEAQVEAILEKLCSKLPKNLADECTAFVEEYGPAVMVLIAQEIDPSIVCVAIKACPKGGLKKQSDLKLKLNTCASCTSAITYIEQALKKTENDQAVAKQLTNACDHVPKEIEPKCKALIGSYGPTFLQSLSQLGSSVKACKAWNMCSEEAVEYKHRPVLLVGKNPCTHGPAHWCHSKENAAACSATEYCKKKVWKQ